MDSPALRASRLFAHLAAPGHRPALAPRHRRTGEPSRLRVGARVPRRRREHAAEIALLLGDLARNPAAFAPLSPTLAPSTGRSSRHTAASLARAALAVARLTGGRELVSALEAIERAGEREERRVMEEASRAGVERRLREDETAGPVVPSKAARAYAAKVESRKRRAA